MYGTLVLLLMPVMGVHVLKKVEAGVGEKAPLKRMMRNQPVAPGRVEAPATNPIIEILEREIALAPGRDFRGYAASFFGASGGLLRKKIGMEKEPHFSPEIYVRSRLYMLWRYGNRFMFTDLWQFNIPTLEEYGQWVTQQLFVFTARLLGNTEDVHNSSFVNVYRPDPRVLGLLGVRFIITDSPLTDPRLRLRAEYELDASVPPLRPREVWLPNPRALLAEPAVPVRLYEVETPNTASYSPTVVHAAGSVEQTVALLSDPKFPVREHVVLTGTLNEPLTPVRESRARIEPGQIRVSASSKGWSLLLLPLQFSNCLTLRGRVVTPADGGPRLYRANLMQTAILFYRDLDAALSFDFGLGRHSGCRARDLDDYRALGIDR
jgi:hypothetical protein